MNVGLLLSTSARKYPHRPAIIFEEERWCFKDLDSRCGQLAGAMQKAGLQKGDRVGILFYNSRYFVEVYFAAVKIGLIATPINFRLAGPEIAYILNDAKPGILFYGPEFETTLTNLHEQLEVPPLLVSPRPERTATALDYEAFRAQGDCAAPALDVCEDDPCQLMYTSGTTGKPKGAILTHRNVLWNLFNTILIREDRSGERALIVGPLYHTAALNNHLTIQVALGGTSIIIRKFEPESLLKTIAKEQATIISGAPALYHMLLQHPRAGDYDTRSINKCTAGSDKMPMTLKKRLLDFFPNIKGIYDIYGCTEASPSIAILRAEDSLRTEGSVGKAAPFVDVRLIDENGRDLPAGEVGELICSGPNVMQGYFRNPAGTRETIRNGWLHTGDLARSDDEGFIYIVDRKKDMIVSGGENIYPRELEEVLLCHAAIAEVAVIGVADPVWGESVKAFVVCEENARIDAQEVINFCRQHLAGYKKPKSVVFVSELPRNAVGKVLKRVLKQNSDPAGLSMRS